MAVALRGTHGVSNGAAGTSASGWTAALSAAAAGVQEGDLMAVTIHLRAGGITAPAGWTQRVVGSSFVATPYWQYAVTYIFTKVATAADVGATFNFQFSMQYASSAHLVAYSGAGRVTPIVGTALSQSDAYVTNRPAGSITATWDAGTWTLSAYTALGAVAASVGTGTKRAGTRLGDATITDQVESWVSDHSGAPSTAQSLTWPSGVVASSASIAIAPRYSETPTAPTPLSPPNASFQSAGLVITLEADFTDPDSGDTPSAYAARIKPSGGAYEWIDASGVLVPTETWVPWVVDTLAAAIDALELTPDTTYNWSLASKDSLGTPSAYHSDRTFTTQAPPEVIATGPDGTQTTTRPTGTWSYSSGGQTHYRAKFFTAAVVAGSGFDPDTSTPVASSGLLASTTAREWQTTTDLVNGDYWFFIQVVENGVESEWESIAFPVELTPATAPAEVVATPEPALARITAEVVAPTRYLDATTAAVEMQRRIGDADWTAITPTEGVDFASWIMADATLALLAETYDPDVAPFWRDLSGNRHHARMGSTWPAHIARGEAHLPGIASNCFTTPDAPANSVLTEGFDLVVGGTANDWTPSADRPFVAKWTETGNQRSWMLMVTGGGILRFYWSIGGAVADLANSTLGITVPDGSHLYVRVTADPDTSIVQFWTCTDYDKATRTGSWELLGVPVASGYAAPFDGNAPVTVSGYNSGVTSPYVGRVTYVELRDGIDGEPAMIFDPSEVADYATSWVSETGETWNVQWPGARVVDDTGLIHPGNATSYAHVALDEGLRITGDLDVRVDGTVSDWTPPTHDLVMIANGDSGGTDVAHVLRVTTTGLLRFRWYETGGTLREVTSDAPAPAFVDGERWQLRVTLDLDNGAGGHGVKFWRRPTSTDAWEQIGAEKNAGAFTTSLRAATSAPVTSRWQPITTPAVGWVLHSFQVLDGIDGEAVLDADFTDLEPYTTAFTCSSGQRVLLLGQTGSDTNYPTPAGFVYEGQHLFLPGTAGNYPSTLDHPALDVTGDLDLRAWVMPTGMTGTDQSALGKYGNSAAGQLAYLLRITTAGGLILRWSVDGTVDTAISSTAPVPIAGDGLPFWVRATLDVNDGAGNKIAAFYYSTDYDPVTQVGTWDPVGTPVTQAGTTSIFASAGALTLGASDTLSNNMLVGGLLAAEVRDGIDGTVVWSEDFTDTDRWDPETLTAWKAMPIPAARATFTRATTAYLDGVEVASGVPRYPLGRNLLTANQASLEDGATTGWAAGANTSIGVAGIGWHGSAALAVTRTAAGVGTADGAITQPIVASTSYALSAYFRTAAGELTCRVRLRWYTAAFGYLSVATGAEVATDDEGWTRATLLAAAPANAAFGVIDVQVTDAPQGGTIYVDGIQLEESAAATAWRPGGPSAVLVEEGTTNLLTANQSSLETDTTGWFGSGSTIARSTAQKWAGAASLLATWDAGSLWGPRTDPRPTAVAGTTYTASVWVRWGVGTPKSCRLAMHWYDGGAAEVGSPAIGTAGTPSANGWVQLTVTGEAPVGAVSVLIAAECSVLGVAADSFYIDGIQLEAKAYPTSWHIGGGTRNPDNLVTANSVVPLTGTVEIDFHYDQRRAALTGIGASRFFFIGNYFADGSLNLWQNTNGLLYFFVRGNAETGWTTGGTFGPVLTEGWHRISITWTNGNTWDVWLDGVRYVTDLVLAKSVTAWSDGFMLFVSGDSGVAYRLGAWRVSNSVRSDAELGDTTSVLAADEATVWLQDFASTLEGEYGQVTTLVRPTTGAVAQLAVVDRRMFVMGADDYADVPHALDGSLDAAAGEDFTVVLAFRAYSTLTGGSRIMLSKQDLNNSANAGWSLWRVNESFQYTFADGAFYRQQGIGNPTPGLDELGVLTRDVDADTVRCRMLAQGGDVSDTDNTTGTTENRLPVTIGGWRATPSGTGNANNAAMHLLGVFVFKAALTDEQLASLAYELSGYPTVAGDPYRAATVHDETAPFHVPVEYRARVLETRE